MSLLVALGANTSMTDALKGDTDVGEGAMELDGHWGGGARDTKAY